MLLIGSCQTNKPQEIRIVRSYPILDLPDYPEPNGNVIPLDWDDKVVTDNDTEIASVKMPFWYYKMIMEYKVKNSKAKAEYKAFVARQQEAQINSQ